MRWLLAYVVLSSMATSMAGPQYAHETLASSDDYQWNAYPSIDRLADGRLLCVFSARDEKTRDKAVVVGTFSEDHGRTWGKPVALIDSYPELDLDANIIVIGKRVIVAATTCPPTHFEQLTTTRTVAVRSDDCGATWSEPFEIPMDRRYTVGKINNGIVLRNGNVLFGYCWEIQLESGRRSPLERDMQERAGVMISRDNGLTWAASVDVSFPAPEGSPPQVGELFQAGLSEPALIESDDGSVYMLARNSLDRLYECRSNDGGQTWSTPVPTQLTSHNAPAALCRFDGDDGKGIMVVWCNSTENRWPLCAAASYDEAKNWSPPRRLAEVEGLQSSYPGCVQAADSALVVVWQQAEKGGKRRIDFARFNEAWLTEPE